MYYLGITLRVETNSMIGTSPMYTLLLTAIKKNLMCIQPLDDTQEVKPKAVNWWELFWSEEVITMVWIARFWKYGWPDPSITIIIPK